MGRSGRRILHPPSAADRAGETKRFAIFRLTQLQSSMSPIVQKVILAFNSHRSDCGADPERFFQKPIGKSSVFALRLNIDTAE
jgi:hypothetical protein